MPAHWDLSELMALANVSKRTVKGDSREDRRKNSTIWFVSKRHKSRLDRCL
jgi:hypothetical protein